MDKPTEIAANDGEVSPKEVHLETATTNIIISTGFVADAANNSSLAESSPHVNGKQAHSNGNVGSVDSPRANSADSWQKKNIPHSPEITAPRMLSSSHRPTSAIEALTKGVELTVYGGGKAGEKCVVSWKAGTDSSSKGALVWSVGGTGTVMPLEDVTDVYLGTQRKEFDSLGKEADFDEGRCW